MPTRRTSPRRTATRSSGLYDRPSAPAADFDDEFDAPRGRLAGAAPWLALLALVLAGGALAYAILVRPAGDLTACRTAAWSAIPDKSGLPQDWSLGSTDLNANGMTISVLGPTPPDTTTNQPVVYASVTCYGDAAGTALAENKKAAEAAGATVSSRSASGDAYDVRNPTTGADTTLFRVGGLIGQVADGGTSSATDLDKITTALAAAMGDQAAAGAASVGPPDNGTGSQEPLGSGDLGAGPSESPFAPDLEALLPASITDTSSSASPPASIGLSRLSASATDVFGQDPSSRALAARIRTLGSTFDQLQIAQAYDETGAIDLSILAFRLPKANLEKLNTAILETWLGSGAEGVKTSSVTLGGRNMTKVDYGDGQTIEYVYAANDAVIVIDTSDVGIATQVAAQLK